MGEPKGTESVARAVSKLLEERAIVEGFLERLLPLKESATPAIYDRVRDDYGRRLEEVEARLADRRDDLERVMGPHRQSVQELERERDGKARTLEEADLRHRVGEYPDAEWESRRSAAAQALQELEEVLSKERTALAKLEKLHGELVAPDRVDEPRGSAKQAEAVEFRLVKNWSAGRRSGLVGGLEPGD